ncbi:hypothetical protein Salat_0509200 [Sesamum alatum]|uniref:Uncharacterized protein n=1 Tax=Sesamum alatum TaxID=300844 RepID=A0AAE1Z590_9LAMI|nr:hypothetical protein Salat_0509200 [Sesamum alatum]
MALGTSWVGLIPKWFIKTAIRGSIGKRPHLLRRNVARKSVVLVRFLDSRFWVDAEVAALEDSPLSMARGASEKEEVDLELLEPEDDKSLGPLDINKRIQGKKNYLKEKHTLY